MSVVVADAGPLRYLVLIDEIRLLPLLFGKIVVPDLVRRELSAPQAPSEVRAWLASSPPWVEGGSPRSTGELLLPKLDHGERAAIALAIELRASLVLMDDRAGVEEARQHGLQVIGTLGLLLLAGRRGIVDVEASLLRLQTTNFRYSPHLLRTILDAWREERGA